MGYLSIRYFNQDALVGLEGDNDKEGFFALNLRSGEVIAGLDYKNYQTHLKSKLNIDINEVSYSYSLNCFASLSCLR